MSLKVYSAITVIGVDIGKNSFHVVTTSAARSCFGRSAHAGRWKHGWPTYRLRRHSGIL